MSQLETVKNDLKRLAANSLEMAFNELERVMSPQSAMFHSFLLIKGQFKKYQEEFLIGLLTQEQSSQIYARLMSAFLNLVGNISEADIVVEKKQAAAEKRGELLYYIPRVMQLLREEKCIVRIAWTELALFEDWKRRAHEVHRKNLRIAEIMGVELFCLSEDNPFQIRSLHASVQLIDSEDSTEWVFYVKPLRTGNYQLALRISVIEMRDNREVKRDLVLEEQISVSTEAPQTAHDEAFLSAPVSYVSGGSRIAAPPLSFISQLSNRYGVMLAVLALGVLSFFTIRRTWKGDMDNVVVVVPGAADTLNNNLKKTHESETAYVDTIRNDNKQREMSRNDNRHYIPLPKNNKLEVAANDSSNNQKKDIFKEKNTDLTKTYNYLAPNDLVNDVLIGGNAFDIKNIKSDISQLGSFSNGLSNIGIGKGVILATGTVWDTQSNRQYKEGWGWVDTSGNKQFNLQDIEFDFTPTQSPLTFEFEFGSEKYLGNGNKYDDVLGFYISSPFAANNRSIEKTLSLIPAIKHPGALVYPLSDSLLRFRPFTIHAAFSINPYFSTYPDSKRYVKKNSNNPIKGNF